MKQGYKDRQDESYAMKGSGVMGHEKKPSKCNPFKAQKRDVAKALNMPKDMRGTPEQAFGYKY